ncbi:hypothetical protein DPMN_103511 [Dreissena polymorpha]|uniref:Uncharacterized protein n=1 Tax=Dreissena polymorpha TaxID=45954 RepID=A0A9D4JZ88_DREPO|nr:hypothetical protein DPMN_103511 [Dreissena polymorpha]
MASQTQHLWQSYLIYSVLEVAVELLSQDPTELLLRTSHFDLVLQLERSHQRHVLGAIFFKVLDSCLNNVSMMLQAASVCIYSTYVFLKIL